MEGLWEHKGILVLYRTHPGVRVESRTTKSGQGQEKEGREEARAELLGILAPREGDCIQVHTVAWG